jgi:hypothetical protein
MRNLPVVLLCVAAAAQAPIYVDPVAGADRAGGGSPANPFKTITFAISQAPAAGPATFYLRPGSYSLASGERFPLLPPDACTIESDPALVPQGARLAVIDTPATMQSAIELGSRPTRNVTVRNLRIAGRMLRGVYLELRAGATVAAVLVEDCEIATQRGVEADVRANARAIVRVLRSRLNAVDSPIAMHTAGTAGAAIDLFVDKSVLVNGITASVVLDARVAGGLQATLRATHLRSGVRYGVLAVTGNGGSAQTRIEHCLLYDHGNNVIGGGISLGAIYDEVAAGGVAPAHRVVNSIFHRNKADAQLGAGANYVWGNNLVTQQDLGTLGGNRLGVPAFANRAENDFHLAPASLGVDLGDRNATTLGEDFDGEPRLSAHAGAAPDLGPDEVFLGATFTSDGARVGQPYTLRASWAPNVPFLLALGTASVPNSFGPGILHLAGPIYDLGLGGTCGPGGVGEVTLQVPNDPALATLVVWWQSAGALAPYLGANAKRTLVLLP